MASPEGTGGTEPMDLSESPRPKEEEKPSQPQGEPAKASELIKTPPAPSRPPSALPGGSEKPVRFYGCSPHPQPLLKTRFSMLMKIYYHQITKGCPAGPGNCPNSVSCRNYHDFKEPKNNFEFCKELVPKGFTDPPVTYVCPSFRTPAHILQLDTLSYSQLTQRAKANQPKNPTPEDTEKAEGDAMSVLRETVMGGFTPEALSYSFLKEEMFYDQALDSVELDTEDLEKSLKFLKEKNPSLLEEAMNSLAQKLSKANITSAGNLRPFEVAFAWEGITEVENFQNFLMPLLAGVARIPKELRTVLARHWSLTMGRERFEQVVLEVLQNFITIHATHIMRIDEAIFHACIALNIFYEANNLHRDGGWQDARVEKTQYKNFYNDVVNNMINLKAEFLKWSQMRRSPNREEGLQGFSFIDYPFILDAASKSTILQSDAAVQQRRMAQESLAGVLGMAHLLGGQLPAHAIWLVLTVDRDNLIQSTLQQLEMRRDDFKKPLKVKFKGEDGIDEGGVRKEFFQLVIKELFDPQFGMFTYNEDTHMYWFNPNTMESSEFRLLGIVMGIAIYNSMLLELRFPLCVYKKLLGWKLGLRDLFTFDEAMYKGMVQLLEFEETMECTVEDTFERTFSVEREVYGTTQVYDLKEGGQDIKLTIDNREEYVDLYVKWVLEESVKVPLKEFSAGLHSVCGGQVLEMFRPEELELMVCGSTELDFKGLKEKCMYDGYKAEDEIIVNFWDILTNEMGREDQGRFLKFSTGTDRVPINGLATVQFVIGKNGDDSEMLPTAHTCFNHLLLPAYTTREKLKEKLTLAIANCTGFGLQ